MISLFEREFLFMSVGNGVDATDCLNRNTATLENVVSGFPFMKTGQYRSCHGADSFTPQKVGFYV